MKKMILFACLSLSFAANAGSVETKKQRDAVDQAVKASAETIKDCGKKFAVTFDWKAYDAIDWTKLNLKKEDYYSAETSTLPGLGDGINKLCADKDYKAAMGKISSIVYKSTSNDQITVKATVKGSQLIIENYTMGSTRSASNFEEAVKAAL